MKKRKLNTKKVIIFLIILIVIITGVVLLLNQDKKDVIEIKPEEKFSNYNYTVYENKGTYYDTLFDLLRTELNKSEYNENTYATLVSQIFISDLFSLDNKTSKNDIGGVQFVYEPYRVDFEKYAKDSIYKLITTDLFGENDDELPIVTNVEIISINQDSYNFSGNAYENSYYVDAIVTYEVDLGYQTSISLVLINNNSKLEIVKMY